MTNRDTTAYAKKINEVCDYIHAHLEDDLTVSSLAQVSGFSKFHFQRQFFAYTGIGVFKFVRLLRLKRASYQLVFNKEYKIIDIAYDAHFDNPESFSRAFKKTFGQTPSSFRQEPKWEPWHEQYSYKAERNYDMVDISIVEVEAVKVAVLEHKGAPELVNHSVGKFIEWRKESSLSPVANSQSYGVPNGDPTEMKPEDFQFDICGSVKRDVPENVQGVINKIIPGGRCAKVRHKGSYDHMDGKIRALYCDWLPSSGEELRDFPCYFHYLNLFPEVAESELITDIYLPLK